jgi:hypothetical protein
VLVLRARLMASWPRLAKATVAEWWVHSRAAPEGHHLHWDMNEAGFAGGAVGGGGGDGGGGGNDDGGSGEDSGSGDGYEGGGGRGGGSETRGGQGGTCGGAGDGGDGNGGCGNGGGGATGGGDGGAVPHPLVSMVVFLSGRADPQYAAAGWCVDEEEQEPAAGAGAGGGATLVTDIRLRNDQHRGRYWRILPATSSCAFRTLVA